MSPFPGAARAEEHVKLIRVVPAARYLHDAARNRDGVGHLLVGDERELHAFSLAKKVVALFTVSRFMRMIFTSRRRCESSSFSTVVRTLGGPFPASTFAWRNHG